MRCPKCGGSKSSGVDIDKLKMGNTIRRRRNAVSLLSLTTSMNVSGR